MTSVMSVSSHSTSHYHCSDYVSFSLLLFPAFIPSSFVFFVSSVPLGPNISVKAIYKVNEPVLQYLSVAFNFEGTSNSDISYKLRNCLQTVADIWKRTVFVYIYRPLFFFTNTL